MDRDVWQQTRLAGRSADKDGYNVILSFGNVWGAEMSRGEQGRGTLCVCLRFVFSFCISFFVLEFTVRATEDGAWGTGD